jgi:hypothetical protein
MKAQIIYWLLSFSLLVIDYFHTVSVIQFIPAASQIKPADLSLDRVLSSDSLKKIISTTTYSKLLFISGTRIDISIPGFTTCDLESLISVNNEKTLHEMQRLALFSLAYGSEILDIYDSTKDEIYLHILSRLTLNTLHQINTFTAIPDVMKYNDHAVSERVGFLILFYKILHERGMYQDVQIRLIDQLGKDISCLWRNDRFMWKSNHGLLQIRSLFDIAEIFKGSIAGNKSRDIASERLSNIIPFLVSPDGAILEGASSYWVFIFNEFEKIHSSESVPDSLKRILDENISRMRRFLKSVVSKDGTLIPVGDSHEITNLAQFAAGKEKSTMQLYSNGLASGNFTKGSSYVHLLYLSLDTPPNIHKLPEDLAIFIRFNGMTLFSGPGIYAYDNSDEQQIIRSETSQSTVTIGNTSLPDSSRIISLEQIGDILQLIGKKWYDEGEIYRTVTFNLSTGALTIDDSSTSMIFSRYTIDPEIRIFHRSDSAFILIWDRDSLVCSYEGSGTIRNSFISRSFHHLVPVSQIELKGKKTRINIPLYKMAGTKLDTVMPGSQLRTYREQRGQLLHHKYLLNENLSQFSYKRLFIGRIGIALLLIFTTLFLNSTKRKVQMSCTLVMSIVSMVILFDIYFDGKYLSLFIF